VVVPACNPATWEVEVGITVHRPVHTKVRDPLRKTNKKKNWGHGSGGVQSPVLPKKYINIYTYTYIKDLEMRP
jgi:hypothetical protein